MDGLYQPYFVDGGLLSSFGTPAGVATAAGLDGGQAPEYLQSQASREEVLTQDAKVKGEQNTGSATHRGQGREAIAPAAVGQRRTNGGLD